MKSFAEAYLDSEQIVEKWFDSLENKNNECVTVTRVRFSYICPFCKEQMVFGLCYNTSPEQYIGSVFACSDCGRELEFNENMEAVAHKKDDITKENKIEYFEITSICRNDLEREGFDPANVDDGTMEELAQKMARAYLECCYWSDMKTIADEMEIPRLDSGESNDT